MVLIRVMDENSTKKKPQKTSKSKCSYMGVEVLSAVGCWSFSSLLIGLNIFIKKL